MDTSIAPAEPLLSGYIEKPQLASELHRNVRTIDRWILRGEGPPFIRVGKKILFRREAVLGWLLARETPARPQSKPRARKAQAAGVAQ